MKLVKVKNTRTFVTSIKYTPKEFLALLKEMGLELEVKIPGLVPDDEGEVYIDVENDDITWDGESVVVTFKPGAYDNEGDYEAYCPEVK